MALAAQLIAINPWVTRTGLPLQCQEKVAHLKLQAWPGEEVQRTAVATAGICCISTCQAPYKNPGVHQDKVGLLVCTVWGQQHPKGEMHLPTQEGSQPCACPGMVSLCTQKGSLLSCTRWSPLETQRPL